jgi:hypothetical protein
MDRLRTCIDALRVLRDRMIRSRIAKENAPARRGGAAGRNLPRQPIEATDVTRRKSSTLIFAVRCDFFALVAGRKV